MSCLPSLGLAVWGFMITSDVPAVEAQPESMLQMAGDVRWQWTGSRISRKIYRVGHDDWECKKLGQVEAILEGSSLSSICQCNLQGGSDVGTLLWGVHATRDPIQASYCLCGSVSWKVGSQHGTPPVFALPDLTLPAHMASTLRSGGGCRRATVLLMLGEVYILCVWLTL